MWGLTFSNPVGLAAGLDNNGDHINGLAKLGFGFIELGGVTPLAQRGNPRPRLFRLKKDKALINQMGFDNKGVDYLVERLKKTTYKGIIGVNIGKNKATAIEDAVNDYLYCFNKLYPHVAYITVNVSSPNTPGLRSLQHGSLLVSLFTELKKAQQENAAVEKKYVPMLVKLAPDLSVTELKETVRSLDRVGVDGFVFSNTTLSREDLKETQYVTYKGGLSGKPLFKKSTALLALLSKETTRPIIGLGGIMTPEDAKAKLQAGASLVQLYTGLIYEGPSLISHIAYSL